MKKAFFIVALVATALCAKAQVNIQEQYDFNREHLTTTLEMFKTDNWGSTFFFTDIYHPHDSVKPVGYYTEIARGLNFWKDSKLGALSAHVEWNGGQFANNAWLFGVEYLLHNEDFSNTFTFELLYKSIEKQTDNTPLQFTFIWGMQNLLNVKGLVFSGFVDVWGEKYTWADPDGTTETTDFVAISEPQLWYNIGQFFNCENLFIGGEVELAYNFQGGWNSGAKFHKNKGFTVAPACGLKWNF
ncbi:MAG: DUF5020 family protein [Bacteroidales bacterium]|nr:DUF5020 family protein [Bacteroidales bacterium]